MTAKAETTETAEGRGAAPGSAFEEGVVQWYSLAKGYGFVRRRGDDTDIFVHHSEIVRPEDSEREMLLEGERVRFELAEGPKGLQARRVERLPQDS